MASLSATLTEFSDNGNSRTFTTSGHSVIKPKLVIEKRIVPAGNQVMAEYSATVVQAVLDSDGGIAPQKVSYGASARYPVSGVDPTDLAAIQAACLVLLKDIVASDEWAASTTSQNWFE